MIEAARKILLKTIYKILPTIHDQSVWENIFQMSLRKMNFGNGGEK